MDSITLTDTTHFGREEVREIGWRQPCQGTKSEMLSRLDIPIKLTAKPNGVIYRFFSTISIRVRYTLPTGLTMKNSQITSRAKVSYGTSPCAMKTYVVPSAVSRCIQSWFLLVRCGWRGVCCGRTSSDNVMRWSHTSTVKLARPTYCRIRSQPSEHAPPPQYSRMWFVWYVQMVNR